MSNPDPMVSAQVQSFIRKIILAAVVYAVGAGVQRGWIPSGQAAMLTEVLTVIGTVVGLQLWSNFNDRVLYQTTPPNNGPAPGSGPGAPPPWHPGSVNGLLVAGATLGLLAASLGVGGCAGLTDTNPVRQTADNIQTATMGTQKLTRVGQEQGSLNIDGSLPTYSSLLDFVSREVGVDGDGRPVYKAFPRVDSTGGGASHEMVMPIGPGNFAAMRSATVLSIRMDKATIGPDGTWQIEGLAVNSDAATANKSVADVAAALAPTWATWSADKRAAVLEVVKAWRDLGVKGMDVLAGALDLLNKGPLNKIGAGVTP
jgi:hypothetical protein